MSTDTRHPLVSVITPVRPHERMGMMIDSLMAQSVQDVEMIQVVDAWKRGPSWARNQGLALARGTYVLFSDADVVWTPDALETMLTALSTYPVQYAYGSYCLLQGDQILETLCAQSWTWDELLVHNIVSTMALVRRDVMTSYRFDEMLWRLEDWDLWLRMGLNGRIGYNVGRPLFTTQKRMNGLTFGGEYDHEVHERYIRQKLGL